MTNHYLSFSTDSMDVCINNYEPYRFNHNGWTVSDNYVHNEKNTRWSQYSIIVTKPNIINENQLYDYRMEGQEIVDLVTSLIPLCGLPPLNGPKYQDFANDSSIFDYKSSPIGWRTNFNEMREMFEAAKLPQIKVSFTFMGISRYSVIDKSPLEELELMMREYRNAQDEIKFLLYLYNSILAATNYNVYMLIGKALEIINAMCPMEERKDRRIEVYFPELSSVFSDYTIKELINLSNNRKEARHYIKDKTNIISHESLNKKERIMMYRCSTCLLLNVIREKLGLSHQTIIYKQ